MAERKKTVSKKSSSTKTKKPEKQTKKEIDKKLEERETQQNKFHREIKAIIMLAVAVLLFFVTVNKGANLWLAAHNFAHGLFGITTILWSVLLIYFAFKMGLSKAEKSLAPHFLACIGGIFLINTFIFVFWDIRDLDSTYIGNNFFSILSAAFNDGVDYKGGGFFAAIIGASISWLFGVTGAKITIALIMLVYLMVITKTTITNLTANAKKVTNKAVKTIETTKTKIHNNKERSKEEEAKEIFSIPKPQNLGDGSELERDKLKEAEENLKGIIKLPENDNQQLPDPDKDIPVFDPLAVRQEPKKNTAKEEITKQPEPDDVSCEDAAGKSEEEDLVLLAQKAIKEKQEKEKAEQEKNKKADEYSSDSIADEIDEHTGKQKTNEYIFPPTTLLKEGKPEKEDNGVQELKINGEKLKKTLQDFHIPTRIVDISRGPAITRYELQPAAGVKISKITGLSDDIAMNLAASGVRIEAPIPGKAAVGIEIPNQTVSVVHTRSILESEEFKKAPSKLTIALGKDISGGVSVADIAKTPHLLIAGSTGSGKSVCINSIILSILYKASPDEVKLLMIDPKVVELGIYNGIPHLMIPVVTDPKKAASALAWAVTEMLKRYNKFAQAGTRDLTGYNKLAEKNEELEKLPQIVIIIDELADLMMVAKKEVEDYIGRLTQMARAAGMHLIIATQRPSVDVITGVIKSNIPSRIAFAVSSQIDSRTILDGSGAEKLIGRGDMLFMPLGANKPIRIQGCFATDSEVEDVVNFIKERSEANYDDDVAQEIENKAQAMENGEESGSNSENPRDEMFAQAVECVLDAGQASTSLLQRKLRLGYARAGRLIDEMENCGIVGPHEGSKPRQVIITRAQWMERNMRED